MTTEAKQPTDDPRPAANPSPIVIAAGTETRRRIAVALAEGDLRVSTQVKTVDAAIALDPGAAVAVFACEIDTPREMASLRRLCREAAELRVVAISSPTTGTAVRRALDAGASGLVFDPELELTLAATVRAVAIGQSVVPGKLRAGVEKPILSHREHEVLALVRRGLTNREIAEHLFLAESTVKSHLASIFTKFGVRSRKEVAAAFVDIDLGSPALSAGVDSPGRASA